MARGGTYDFTKSLKRFEQCVKKIDQTRSTDFAQFCDTGQDFSRKLILYTRS